MLVCDCLIYWTLNWKVKGEHSFFPQAWWPCQRAKAWWAKYYRAHRWTKLASGSQKYCVAVDSILWCVWSLWVFGGDLKRVMWLLGKHQVRLSELKKRMLSSKWFPHPQVSSRLKWRTVVFWVCDFPSPRMGQPCRWCVDLSPIWKSGCSLIAN